MPPEINQDELSPEDAKASLGIATGFMDKLFQNQNSSEMAQEGEMQASPESPLESSQDSPQGATEPPNDVKGEIAALRAEVEKALKEDQVEDKEDPVKKEVEELKSMMSEFISQSKAKDSEMEELKSGLKEIING